MKYKREDKGNVTVLRLEGKLMGGPDADEFKKVVKQIVADGGKNVLVDLGKVSWVNSTGRGILISNYTTLKNQGGSLKLVHVNQRIRQIFTVTKLHMIFDTFEDEEEALASF